MATFLKTLKLIHIHPILIIFIIISIITGTFIHLFILLSIVFIHEFGHVLAAKYYKWRITAIDLWIFGGVMKTDEIGNRPIKEDIIVTLAGPLQHVFIFLFLLFLLKLDLISSSIIHTALQYNWMIFFFNLLPIYPLDGGKLLFYCLSAVIPFRNAHKMTIVFSLCSVILIILFQLFILPFTLSALLIMIFLMIENRSEWKNHYYLFIRFLLQRLNEPVNFKYKKLYVTAENRLIDIFSLFMRNRNHQIYVLNRKVKFLSEKESLRLYFKQQKLTETIGEIMKYK